jgi:hypothetical protein
MNIVLSVTMIAVNLEITVLTSSQIDIQYSLSSQKELVYGKLFYADLNCLVLLDNFLIW